MRSLILLCSIILLLAHKSEVKAQWQACSGLEGARTNSIYYSDSTLLVNTYPFGIYLSDLSSSWVKSNSSGVGLIFKAGDCLFTSSAISYMRRSFDNGVSWESPPYNIMPRSACAIDSVIFVEYYNYIARSYNHLDSFEILTNLPDLEWPLICSDDSLLLVIDDINDLIYQSVDYGYHWDSITSFGLVFQQFSNLDMTSYENTIFLGGIIGSYYLNESRDEWIKIPDPFDDFEITSFYKRDNQLLCGTIISGIYSLDFNQKEWILYTESASGIWDMCEVDDLLFCATREGPYFLDDTGILYPFFDGLNHRNITSLDVINDSIYVIGSDFLYKSTDNGLSFSRYDNIKGKQLITTDSATYLLTHHGIVITKDDFVTNDTFDIPANSLPQRFSMNKDFFYLIMGSGCFRSGVSFPFWHEISNKLGGKFSYIATLDSVVLASDITNNAVFISYDNANNFEQIFNVNNWAQVGVVDSSFYVLDGDSIFLSHDLGLNWDILTAENHFVDVEYIDFWESVIFYGSSMIGAPYLSVSYDYGLNWQDILDNLPYSFYQDFHLLKINGNRFFVSSKDHGLWYRDDILTRIPSLKKNRNESDGFIVSPNPARDKVSIIAGEIQEDEEYQIMNMVGQIVLFGRFNNTRNEIDISNIEPGMYIINLKNQHSSLSKKFIKY